METYFVKITQSFSSPYVEVVPEVPDSILKNWKQELGAMKSSLEVTSFGNGKVHESDTDFFFRETVSCQQISSICHNSLAKLIATITDIEPQQFNQLVFDYQSWLQIVDDQGFSPYQNHPNGTWTGLYCIDTDLPSEAEPDSGMFLLHDPRVNANQIADDVNGRYKFPMIHAGIKILPKPGELYMFPSYQHLENFAYFGNKPRILVWFNAWIRNANGLPMQPKKRYIPKEVKPYVMDY